MIHLLYGTEEFLIERKINDLINKQDSDLDLSKYDLEYTPIEEIVEEAMMPSLFSDKRIIIAKNAFFLTGTTKKSPIVHNVEILEKYVKSPDEQVHLILTVPYEKLDVRKKIVKALREQATIWECQRPALLNGLVREVLEGYQITDSDITLLLNRCSAHLGVLESELNKLKIYKQMDTQITKEDIEEVISHTTEPDLFEFVNCLVKKDKQKALEIYYEMMKKNEEPIKIIVVLANQFRLLYQVKELIKKGYSESDIASILEVHPYPVKLAREKGRQYESRVLLTYLEKLADLDYDIKTGKVNKDIGLEMFIASI